MSWAAGHWPVDASANRGARGRKVPEELRELLAPLLADDLKSLAERFGGHPKRWFAGLPAANRARTSRS